MGNDSGDAPIRRVRVWDLPTRLFHWINALCVLAMIAIGLALLNDEALGLTNAAKILLKTIHVSFGYVLAVNLAWRLVWAFFGNRHARWAAILPAGSHYRAALRAYLRGLKAGAAPPYLGHNPLARLMVSLLLLLLLVQAGSGLVLAGTDLYFPPFGGSIAAWVAAPETDPATLAPYDQSGIDPAAWKAMQQFREAVEEVHLSTFFLLLAAVAVHVAAVVVTELREGGAIVSAMFTGNKFLDRPASDQDPREGG